MSSSTSKKERQTQDQPGGSSAMLRKDRLVLRSDYDDRDDNTWRTDIYRELESVRIERGRKPGWTKIAYRELFGCWPERWMESLHPMPASEALQKWVRSKDNAYKRELKKKNGTDAGGALLRGAASVEGEDHKAGASGKVEGGPGASDMESGDNAMGDGEAIRRHRGIGGGGG